jgi:hypothetical protein
MIVRQLKGSSLAWARRIWRRKPFVTFGGSPAGSYGLLIGPSWTGDDPWGSGGTVRYHVDHNQISGATNPVVYGPRAVAG